MVCESGPHHLHGLMTASTGQGRHFLIHPALLRKLADKGGNTLGIQALAVGPILTHGLEDIGISLACT